MKNTCGEVQFFRISSIPCINFYIKSFLGSTNIVESFPCGNLFNEW